MYALTNVNIYTVKNGFLKNASIVIDEEIIADIGKEIKIPKKCVVYDLKGKYLTPGFIDAHCHVGIFNEGTGEPGVDGNDCTDPITPYLKAADGIYSDDEAFQDALENGVTTLCIAPGSGNVIGGQMAVLKPKSNILSEMLITDFVGMKCAFGENPKSVYGSQSKMPSTRMGIAALLKKELTDAANYLKQKMFDKNDKSDYKKPFKIDFNKEPLLPILNKEKPLRAHAHRMDDIQTAVRIAKEYDLNVVIEHATESYKIAPYLAENEIPIIIGPLNGTRSKVELKDMTLKAPKILEENGVDFAVMTDAPVERIGSLFDDIRLFIRHGLSKEKALEAVTINPAKILGLDQKQGSLEKGKLADLNVFDGDPFDFRSKITTVTIEGEVLFGGFDE